MNKSISTFLATGKIGRHDPQHLIEECGRLIREETQRSTDRSLELSQKLVDVSGQFGDIPFATALRAAGWAQLVAGKYPDALRSYQEARKILRSSPIDRARIDRILIDVFMYLGKYAEARKRAGMALRTFKTLGEGAETAKTQVNWANVLHRSDRHREARQLYQSAADFFENANNPTATALCWYNLANTETQLFDFDLAQDHFQRARELFIEHQRPLHATGCLYGLAWLNMLRGEFHIALHQLAECEDFYIKGGQTRELLLCLLDRAEVYLGLNLYPDARREAERALTHAKALKIDYENSKAELFIGKALIGLGRFAEANKHLKRAETGFKKQSNYGFLTATQMSLVVTNRSLKNRHAELTRVRNQFKKAQLPLWEAICDFQILEATNETNIIKRLSTNRAVQTIPQLAAQYHTVRGDIFSQNNRPKQAVSHWTRAADILDAIRAKLPPVEIRSSFFSNRNQPHNSLVDHEYQHNPLNAATWSERIKTAGLWTTNYGETKADPSRSRISQSLADLALQFATTTQLTSATDKKRVWVQPDNRYTKRIKSDIRHFLSVPSLGSTTPTDASAIQELLIRTSNRTPILQFHVGRKDIIAFIHESGQCRTIKYCGAVESVRKLVAQWRFQIERAQTNARYLKNSDLHDENDVLNRLSQLLLPPMEISHKWQQILVIPEAVLLSVPWGALRLEGRPIIEQYRLSITPSARHYSHADKCKTNSRKRRIFVGSSEGLSYLPREIAVVKSRLGEKTTVFDRCHRSDWLGQEDADIWHYAGHAEYRADNPFYSSLLLHDGPLFAADFRIRSNNVNLVTLAACRTGQQNFRSGEESSGLVRSLLEMGARSVVASNWAVSDRSTSQWMDHFYNKYRTCKSAAEAVQFASLHLRENFRSAYHWSAFLSYGH